MGEVRMAVVGGGRMGVTHAETLAHRTRGARLVAVTTSNAERAGQIRNSCGEVAIYPSLDQLLEAERLDAAVIASSTSAHVENVERCAAAGIHMLCEKPLGLDLEGCDRAVAAAKAAGVKLMVGHMQRFDSGYVEAKRLIEAGAIGVPVIVRAISGDMDPPPASFADLSVSGGLLLDSMYHDFYLSRWLMADEIVRVYTEAGALIDEGVRSVGDVDNAVVSARFAGGALGTMTASRVTRYGNDLRTEVIGDEGAVQVGYFRQTPVRLLDRKGVHHDTPHSTPDRMGEAFVRQLQAFVDWVRDDTDPPVSTADARATVAVSLAATRSIRDRAPVEVELPTPPRSSADERQSSARGVT
jgi:myo-inositol 2-dehydrogenase/D-chiro-inositol 1-dehydrogenase